MKIIYYCYGGAHSSVTAAAIHLGKLPENRIPSNKEIMKIPLYDTSTDKDHGNFFLMGTDSEENEIYVVGCRSLADAFPNILKSISDLVGKKNSDTILINTLSVVNWYMRIGGFLSRKLKIVVLGRPLVLYGTRKSYKKFLNLVNKVKERNFLVGDKI